MRNLKPIAFSFVISLAIAFIFLMATFYILAYSEPDAMSDALGTTGSYFGAVATLGAAIVAAYLFTDWKEQHNKSIVSGEAKIAFNLIHKERNSIHDIKFFLEKAQNIDEYGIHLYRGNLISRLDGLKSIYNKNKDNLSEFVNLTENSDFHKKYLNFGKLLNGLSSEDINNLKYENYILIKTRDVISELERLNGDILNELKKYIFA